MAEEESEQNRIAALFMAQGIGPRLTRSAHGFSGAPQKKKRPLRFAQRALINTNDFICVY
jgi:hypothetical protein